MWLTWWLEARSHYRLGLSILELYAGGTTGPSSDSWKNLDDADCEVCSKTSLRDSS